MASRASVFPGVGMRFLLPWIATLCCVLVVPVPARAAVFQETAAPAAPDELSREQVEARLNALPQDASLSEEQRASLAETYRAVLDALKRAAEQDQRAQQFAKQRQEAPALLEQRQEELDQPAPAPVAPDPAAGPAELEAGLKDLEAKKNDVSSRIAELEGRPQRLRVLIETATQQEAALEEAEAGRELAPEGPEESAAAQRLLREAEVRAAQATLQATREEIAALESSRDLIRVQRDLAQRDLVRLEAQLDSWRQALNARRQEEAELAASRAEQERREAAQKHPLVGAAAELNAALARERSGDGRASGITQRIDYWTRRGEEIVEQDTLLHERYDTLKGSIERSGLSDTVGTILRSTRGEIPREEVLAADAAALDEEATRVDTRLLDLKQLRRPLADVDAEVQRLTANLDPPATSEQHLAEIRASLRDLLNARRDFIDALLEDYQAYSQLLVKTGFQLEDFRKTAEEVRLFVEQHVLWTRSTGWIGWPDLQALINIPYRILADGRAMRSTRNYGAWVVDHLIVVIPIVLAFLIVGGLRRKMRATIARLSDLTSAETDSIEWTVLALLLSFLLALFWPAILYLFGLSLKHADGVAGAAAIAEGIRMLLGLFLAVELLRVLCMSRGVAPAHFRWAPRNIKLLQKILPRFVVIGFPLVFLTAAIRVSEGVETTVNPSRIPFIVGHIALVYFMHRLLSPTSGVVAHNLARGPEGRWARIQFLWYLAAVMLPVFLAVLAAVGYFFTALHLAERVLATLWIVLLMVLVHSFVMRWSFIARRRFAIEQARKRKAAEEAAAAAGTPSGEAAPPPAPAEISVREVDAQTRQLLRTFLGFGLILGIWFIWVDVFPALEFLDRVELGHYTEDVVGEDGVSRKESIPITLNNLLIVGVILMLTSAAAKNIPGVLEISLLQRLPLDQGGRYAILTIARYTISIVGIIAAFGAVGVSWGHVQWLAAAVTVGLGFGMQEIFANFVSGLILLFERPVRVGDVVTIGESSGTVSRIRMRATTLVDWDRREIVIPNKEFVTGRLVNWSLTDTITRLVIPVGVAYGTDTDKVTRILLKVARTNRDVLNEPPPSAFFLGFGDSSLNFELRAFVSSIDSRLRVTHELHGEIARAFAKEGVEIPFPQRDLHLRSMAEPLRLQTDHPGMPDEARKER